MHAGAVTQIGAGGRHSLAVTASGQLYAFGRNTYGELGNATNSATATPNPTPALVALPAGTTIDTVAKGALGWHTLALVSNLAIATHGAPRPLRLVPPYQGHAAGCGRHEPADVERHRGCPPVSHSTPQALTIGGKPTDSKELLTDGQRSPTPSAARLAHAGL